MCVGKFANTPDSGMRRFLRALAGRSSNGDRTAMRRVGPRRDRSGSHCGSFIPLVAGAAVSCAKKKVPSRATIKAQGMRTVRPMQPRRGDAGSGAAGLETQNAERRGGDDQIVSGGFGPEGWIPGGGGCGHLCHGRGLRYTGGAALHVEVHGGESRKIGRSVRLEGLTRPVTCAPRPTSHPRDAVVPPACCCS